ncbi:class I SAM-dependent methyltransferase [Flavihumibacter sp. R14]|nr:class I SAM-dependent methyltransferase [Flavihumibacter soli]
MKNTLKKILPDRMLNFLRKFNQPQNSINLEDYYLLEKSKITYGEDLLYTLHNSDFTKDPHFIESYNLGKDTDNGTLLKDYDIRWRIHVLCWAASHAMHLEGDFVDCGVHTGICARAVVNYVDFNNSNKKYFLLDTFNGLDARYSTAWELRRNTLMGYDKEDSDTLYNQVKETFKDFNVSIIRGTVPDTLSQVTSNQISYLSIDMNCVAPEVAALEFFWDKMVSGGMIVLDDYGYANSTNDQKKAHDEFASSKNIRILTLPTCQGLIIKP